MFDFIPKMKREDVGSPYYFLLVFTVAVLYVLAAKVRFSLTIEHDIVSIVIFASEGIALGSALFFGKKVWPGIFLGQFIVALDGGMGSLLSLEISMINSLEAIIAVYVFDWYRLDRGLLRLKDMIGLVLIIVLVLQPFSAVLGSMALLIHGVIQGNEYLETLFSWWFGNVMGQLLFAPFTLLVLTHYKRIRLLEFLLYGFGFAIFIYFLEVILVVENLSLLLTFTIPVVIFIVAQKGLVYGTLFAIIVAVVSSYSVYLDVGIFSTNSLLDNVININFFILAHISMVLISGPLFEERKQNEYLLQERVKKEVLQNKEQQLLMFQQSRLAQMGEMIAMIAHQWRQPLNGLSLVNQIIVIKYQRGVLDDEAMISFKQKSQGLIGHMSATIDDFRNFFKSENEKKEFCVNEPISKTLDLIESMITPHGINIIFDTSKSYYAYGYSNEFSQVVLSLLTNAKDALVEKELEEKVIRITLDKIENETIITIDDNAGGIPEAIIDKIFDPYFSTKENKNGTGLGLYMAKMIIVDHMNGDITVSNSEEGASFKISLSGSQ